MFIFFFGPLNFALVGQAQNLADYHITIGEGDLGFLYDNPSTDEYFDAVFEYNNEKYPCQVRFRGGTSRTLPKKSWKIKFPDDDNPYQCEKLNLNAEYRDNSLLRNHLAMKLFQYFHLKAPGTNYTNLYINDSYAGVFLQVENVDEFFLEKYGLKKSSLYKARNHGACFAPLFNFDDYADTWEKKVGDKDDYDDLLTLLNQLFYWTHDDFKLHIEQAMDVQNVLFYFAIEYVLVSQDCFTKNFYLYHNSKTDLWEILPWDNDSTFGNNWKGIYYSDFTHFFNGGPLLNQVLFQRIIEFPEWQEQFWNMVDDVIHNGFDYLFDLIDETKQYIASDVYQDKNKIGSNEEFVKDIENLKTFMDERRKFLSENHTFERKPLTDFYCSNPFPAADNPMVTFRVKASEKQNVCLEYIPDFQYVERAVFEKKRVQLYDDGCHSDGECGDLIYGNTLDLSDCSGQTIPYYFTTGVYTFPANGSFYMNYIMSQQMAVNFKNSNCNAANALEFGHIYKIWDDYFVELINNSNCSIDLSYCMLQVGHYWQRYLVPKDMIINPFEKIILTTNKELAQYHFKDEKLLGGLFFDIEIGDSVKLLSSSWSELKSMECKKFYTFESDVSDGIVINEINYSSSAGSGDWIELYNNSTHKVSLLSWALKDDNDKHLFTFPPDSYIKPYDYLVVCQDTSSFKNCYPLIENICGSFDFGLSAKGDMVRIFNISGQSVDSVCYDNKSPWPVGDEQGSRSIELINPLFDNSNGIYWRFAKSQSTPGCCNNNYIDNDNFRCENNSCLMQNFPNPFNAKTQISYRTALDGVVEIKIFNTRGQLVEAIKPLQNRFSFEWNAEHLCSGIYFCQLYVNNKLYNTTRMVLLK